MASLAELNKKRFANLQKRRAVNEKIKRYNDAVAGNEIKNLVEDEAVANIEGQLSEVRAANAKKAAGAVGNVLGNIGGKANNAYQAAAGKVADSGAKKAQKIVNDTTAEYAPQKVSASMQAKIDEIGADSKLKRGTQLYKKQAELTDKYMNARTAEEQTAAKGELDALQKQLPAKGIERAVNAIGGGVVSLEAGVGKMLNPTSKGGSADKVLGNVDRANVTGKAGLGAVGGLMYDAVQTVSNNAAAMAAGGVFGKAAGGVSLGLMGTSAAGSSVREAQNAGAKDGLAVAAGVANGIIEAAFEKVPLDNLFKLAKAGANDKVIKDGLMGYAMSVAKQAGLEGASEGGTTIAQNFANRMIYEKSLKPEESWGEWWTDTGKEAAYSVLLGGLVGGMMGTPAAVAGRRQEIAELQQEKAVQAAQNAQGEESITQAAQSGESGQNAAENINAEQRTAVDTNPQTHTAEQMAELNNYVAATDEGLYDFVSRYIEDDSAKFGRYTISEVSNRQAEALKNMLGGDFSGYKHAINSDAIKHINKRHGASGEHDNTMREPADIARAGYVIANFDNVELLKSEKGEQEYTGAFKGSDGKAAPMVRYSKKIDGNYYVVEAVADNKYKKLWVVSAYMSKDSNKNGTVTQVSNADKSTLNITPETPPVSPVPSDNNIANTEEHVKGAEARVDIAGELKQAQQLCDKLGLELRITKLPDGVEGYYFDGVITISPTAKMPVREVFVHELTHYLEQSGGYKEYADFVTTEFIIKHGRQAFKSYKAQLRELYARAGEQLSEESALREVVAEHTEELLASEEIIGRLAAYDGGLFHRIYNWLCDMSVMLRGTREEKSAVRAVRYFEAALREMDTAKESGGKGKYRINPKFAQQLDTWDGKSQITFELGTTSEALQSIGIDDRHIVMHGAKVQKILQKHAGMSMNVIKQVPEILENPIVVLKSKQSESRVVMFGEVQDELGAPLLAVIELQPTDGRGEILDLNIVASAYGKNGNVANLVKNSEVLYLDTNKKRTDSWFQRLGLQLPSFRTSYGSLGSITYEDGKVNIRGIDFAENVKGQKSMRVNREEMMKKAQADQEAYDKEEKEIREMELADELADLRESARAKVSQEEIDKRIYLGLNEAYAIKEFSDKAISLYNIPKGRRAIARSQLNDYAKEAMANRGIGVSAAATDNLADFLYSIGGVMDDTLADSNLGLLQEMDKYKIYVPSEVRENIGGFRSVKEDSKLKLRTRCAPGTKDKPYDRSWARIDDVYEELQEQFGYASFPELDNQTARLQRLIEVRESIEPRFLTWRLADDKMGMDSFKPLHLELNKLVNEFVRTSSKINNERIKEAEERSVRRKENAEQREEKYREAAERALAACKGNRLTGEGEVDVSYESALEFAPAQFIQEPSAGVGLYNRDLTQGLELISRNNKVLGEWLKDLFVRPLDAAKDKYGIFVKREMGEINRYMEEHGFKKGSEESAAIQRIGEGKRLLRKEELVPFGKEEYDKRMEELARAEKMYRNPELIQNNEILAEQIKNWAAPKQIAQARKDLQKWLKDGKRPPYVGETTDYTLADLQRDFPGKWQEIQAAAEFIRGKYDKLHKDVNDAYAIIYPNAQKKEEERVNKIVQKKTVYAQIKREEAEENEVLAQMLEEKAKITKEKLARYKREGKAGQEKRAVNLLQQQERSLRAARARSAHCLDEALRAEDLVVHILKDFRQGNNLRQKQLAYRKDYFHHYQESGGVIRQAIDIWNTPAETSSILAGISADTKPNSRFHGFQEERSGHMAYTEDAFGGLQKYLQEAASSMYIDPMIKDFRKKVAGIALATENTRNANQTILWLTRVTDSLAGKTNSLDRAPQELLGRRLMRELKLFSGAMRKNSVMYNLGTFFVQIGNWPNLQLMGVSAVNQGKALLDWLECFARPGSSARELLENSSFMRERYLDDVINQMDYNKDVFGNVRRFGNWMLQFGDEQVARHIWFSAYRQGQANKVEDPIEYADDITRRCVAGRGIGEMSLLQESELVKLVAPFQVEVANTLNQMIYWGRSKELSKLERGKRFFFYFAHIWALNFLLEKITGRRPLPDIINAIIESIAGWDDEEDKSVVDRGIDFAKEVFAEAFSFVPFATTLVGTLIANEDDRKAILGDNDLTRYGTGNIFLEEASALVADIISGDDVFESGTGLALSVLMPGGAGQLKKTVGTLQDMGKLPKFELSRDDGFSWSLERGSYTAGGKLRFDMDDESLFSTLQGLAFGRYATKGGREYIKNGAKPILTKEKVSAAREFEKAYGVTMGEYAKIYASIKELEGDYALNAAGQRVLDKEGEPVRVRAGSKYECMGFGKSQALKKKEEIDKMTPNISTEARKQLYRNMGISEKVWDR